jgi:hypothetical protein
MSGKELKREDFTDKIDREMRSGFNRYMIAL